VSKEKYIGTLPRLRDAVKRKQPKNWRIKGWFLLHDNVPAHQWVLVKKFLATLDHPPHAPDLVPANIYLFPQLKSARRDIACVVLLTSLRM